MNLYWMHGRWREVEPVKEKYSPLALQFFKSDFDQRKELIEQIKNDGIKNCICNCYQASYQVNKQYLVL